MDAQKQQVIDRLQKANNVLVTINKNPSIDQLSACIGLSLVLNKLGKHATAVYSGETPSMIEFLKPSDTIEKNTDSLRDFIISLDKSKADKLRYKVEDQVVRIFITPYKTSITGDDLEFSQGDFNVDVVLAIGVHNQEDLDQAITAHGRILHDATLVTINNSDNATIGSINWFDTSTSSLSEMTATIAGDLGKEVLDEQIATALLTGVVAETERFSNEKTSAETMKISAMLMAAGANQQLVAAELQAPETPEPPAADEQDVPQDQPENSSAAPENEDGTLQIEHDTTEQQDGESPQSDEPLAPAPEVEVPAPPIEYDDPAAEQPKVDADTYQNSRHVITDSLTTNPTFTSAATGSTNDEEPDVKPSIDLPPVSSETEEPQDDDSLVDSPKETLEDIEKQVHSPHVAPQTQELQRTDPKPEAPAHPAEELDLADLQTPSGIETEPEGEPKADVDAARDAVAEAMAAANTDVPPAPIVALNAQQFGGPLRDTEAPIATAPVPEFPTAEETMTMPLPSTVPPQPSQSQQGTQSDPNAAPPVPPPFMPPFSNQ